jgi:hypothetical protein
MTEQGVRSTASDPAWFKSSYSTGNGGECVEVAVVDQVHVRDSKNLGGPILTLSPEAWNGFVRAVGERRD